MKEKMMLLTDLDGTFLNPDKTIPPENIEACQRLYDDFKIPTIIATARPPAGAIAIARKIGGAAGKYAIACNGAAVVDVKTGNLLLKKPISKAAIQEVVRISQEEQLEIDGMTDREIFNTKYKGTRLEDPFHLMHLQEEMKYIDNLESHLLKTEEDILLLALNGTKEEMERARQRLERYDVQCSAPCPRMRRVMDVNEEERIEEIYYIDIMRKGVTKSSTALELAKREGVKQENIIAAGDGGNDIEMLETAGIRVAMPKGNMKLINMADIAPSDDMMPPVARALNLIHSWLIRKQKREENLQEKKEGEIEIE